jgi:hypothetical protein
MCQRASLASNKTLVSPEIPPRHIILKWIYPRLLTEKINEFDFTVWTHVLANIRI